MAKGKSTTNSDGPNHLYPTLEEFLEQESRASIASLFVDARVRLSEVKGSKAATAKKANAAIEKTEGLLHHLFDVKDRLASEAPSKPRK